MKQKLEEEKNDFTSQPFGSEASSPHPLHSAEQVPGPQIEKTHS